MTAAAGTRSSLPACPICSGIRRERFTARLLHKYDVRYFFCDSCGLLQTEEPYWLDEAYGRAIADADTGLVSRNLDIAARLASLLYFCFERNGRFLEFAGGYGLLTRLMRDRGFDFYWHDTYCENIFARGFEWNGLQESRPAAAVTAFEVIEHVWDPAEMVRSALAKANSKTLILSTLPYEGEPPRPEDWWYYSLATGQHISFFRRETLRRLAQKLGLQFYTAGSFQIMTSERISPTAFRLCTGRLAKWADRYVQGRMASRTFADHQKIVGCE